jgi:hypothetical protein
VPAILVDNSHDTTQNDDKNLHSPVSGSSAALMSGLASPISPTSDSMLLDYFWRSDSTFRIPASRYVGARTICHEKCSILIM